MAFSSNWSQLANSNNQLQENGSIVSGQGLLSHQLQPFPQNPNPNHHHATSTNSLPTMLGGSMLARARQARAPPPEGALRCPRCNCTNTKFCYYNNYNRAQPRYSCKGCRRYWTHGGTLRNVPVGGGSRKNSKKVKNGNSKPSSSKQSSTVYAPGTSSGQLRTNNQLPTLHSLTQLGGMGLNLAVTNGNNQAQHIGSSLMNDLGFLNVGDGRNIAEPITGNIHDINNLMSHFTLFDPTGEQYAFHNEGNIENNIGMVDSGIYQVKVEDQSNLVNLPRPVSGLTPPGNQTNQYFVSNSDYSGF